MTDDLPLLSIIVPVYNAEAYLPKCLDSILAQTYNNLEIIVVNDGSTDSSLQICKTYATKDFRIKFIDQPNRGVSCARNSALKVATGMYLGFVDSDDWVEKDMYEVLFQMIKKYNAEIAISSYKEERDGLVKPYRFIREEGVWNKNEALIRLNENKVINSFSCTKLFLRTLWENISYPESERDYEDIAILYRVFAQAQKIAYTPLPLYNYLIRKGSLSHPVEKEMENKYNHMRNYQNLNLFLLKEGVIDKVYPKAISRCIRFIKYLTLHRDSLEAQEIYKLVIPILSKYNEYPLTWKRPDLHLKKHLILNDYSLYKRIVKFI